MDVFLRVVDEYDRMIKLVTIEKEEFRKWVETTLIHKGLGNN